MENLFSRKVAMDIRAGNFMWCAPFMNEGYSLIWAPSKYRGGAYACYEGPDRDQVQWFLRCGLFHVYLKRGTVRVPLTRDERKMLQAAWTLANTLFKIYKAEEKKQARIIRKREEAEARILDNWRD